MEAKGIWGFVATFTVVIVALALFPVISKKFNELKSKVG